MAKIKGFQMLYCIKAVVRRFEGNDQNTVAMTVGYKDALSGTRVYRGLDDPWTKAIIDSSDDETLTKDFLAEQEDGYEITLDEPVKLEEGVQFSEPVPPLQQRFTVNGRQMHRRVDTVNGVLLKSSGLTIDDMVRRTMTFRLTQLDANGEHVYGVPKRKSVQLQLLQYWDGEIDYNFDADLTALADQVDAEAEAENEGD